MTPQQIVAMAAKLFAIWLLVIALQLFAASLAIEAQVGDSRIIVYLLPALPLLLAVLLWLFPMTVADRLIPRTHDSNIVRTPAREVTAIASAIIGLWVLIGSIPVFVTTLGLFLASDQSLPSAMYLTPDRKWNLLGVSLQCVLALYLVFKPWSVARRVFPNASLITRGSE